MAEQTEPRPVILSELKARIEQLEQQADALRSGLDEIAVLLAWTTEHSIPASAVERIPITDQQILTYSIRDGRKLSSELVRLFLQAHTLATRLKQIVPPEEKHAIVQAVTESFRKLAAEQQLQLPVEMEVTVGD